MVRHQFHTIILTGSYPKDGGTATDYVSVFGRQHYKAQKAAAAATKAALQYGMGGWPVRSVTLTMTRLNEKGDGDRQIGAVVEVADPHVDELAIVKALSIARDQRTTEVLYVG